MENLTLFYRKPYPFWGTPTGGHAGRLEHANVLRAQVPREALMRKDFLVSPNEKCWEGGGKERKSLRLVVRVK